MNNLKEAWFKDWILASVLREITFTDKQFAG